MIGLIFGETDLPKEILKKVKKNKIKYLIIDLTKNNIFKKDINSNKVTIGQFGKIINILKKNNCKKVLFAGKVNRPTYSNLKLDMKGLYHIPKIIKLSKLGDAAILREIINILNKDHIKVISSTSLNPELSLHKGIYTKLGPNVYDNKDIKKGINKLKTLSAHNHTQGLIVRDNIIIATEEKNGTKKMLQAIKGSKYCANGVLIKYPKARQDLRIDLPTIGLDTLKDCKKAGLKGIVIKAKKKYRIKKN